MTKDKKSLSKVKIEVNSRKINTKIYELGYSQESVAEIMEIDKSTLNLKINNKRNIYMVEVAKLCIILDIHTPEDLKDYFGLDFLSLPISRENATNEIGGGA